MKFETKTVFQTNGQGFTTLQKEIVDRQKAREAIMTNISEGLAKESPLTIDIAKMDIKAFISDLRKEAVKGYTTNDGIAMKNAAKQLIQTIMKEIDNKKAGLSFAKLSHRPDKMERVKEYMAELEQLEAYLKQLTDLTGFTLKYDYEYINPIVF
ncbi:hypothetical protein ACPF7I_06240 [Anoxybacillus sp. D401a]|uniref:hypothetical protein n=1 Tax=Anoxybacillus sp. D401a TaxID=575112 RepID=UPI003D327CC2